MAAPSPPRSPSPMAVEALQQGPQQQQTEHAQSQADSQPGGIAYDAIAPSTAFADALMDLILSQTSLAASATASASAARSSRTPQVSSTDQPDMAAEQLPLPLHSPLRTYKSAVPGLELSHPGGWLEGSRPPPAAVDALARHFLDKAEQSGRTGPRQMARDVDVLAQEALETLRERMRERQAAAKHNEAVDKQIRALELERQAERMVEDMSRRKRAGGA